MRYKRFLKTDKIVQKRHQQADHSTNEVLIVIVIVIVKNNL